MSKYTALSVPAPRFFLVVIRRAKLEILCGSVEDDGLSSL